MKRRTFLAGTVAVAAGGLWLSKPGNEGEPHSEYFQTLSDTLKKDGPMRPVMLIDLDKLDANIDALNAGMPADKHFRIVAKSLPSSKMLRYIADRAKTERLMAFHQPFLSQYARDFPQSDILMGKPMPVEAAARFYRLHPPGNGFNPANQLQWLVDTPERMQHYLQLAQQQNLKMLINIELNVGLHRGGVTAGDTLAAMLKLIADNPMHLSFSGFMGYDPHVVKVPSVLASRETLLQRVADIYEAAIAQVKSDFAGLWNEQLTMNAAGSPTYRLHKDEKYSTELAIGSALVKPTDFDLDTLEAHTPAAYIATPVLKASGPIKVPGLDDKSGILSWWDQNQRRSYFTYGGYWKAKYESPKGLRNSGLYGHSTNQELALGSAETNLKVGDQIFLRPTQSEFVMLQFGDLLAVRGGKIVDLWPVLRDEIA